MGKECNKEETGCDLNCIDCSVPDIEPEWCESCFSLAEEDGVEYEPNFTHINGWWECEYCNQGV